MAAVTQSNQVLSRNGVEIRLEYTAYIHTLVGQEAACDPTWAESRTANVANSSLCGFGG